MRRPKSHKHPTILPRYPLLKFYQIHGHDRRSPNSVKHIIKSRELSAVEIVLKETSDWKEIYTASTDLSSLKIYQ